MQTPARLVAAAVLSVSVLAVSACSGGDDKATDPASAPEAKECTADDIQVDGDFGSVPEITLPDDCDPPTSLLTKDLVAGDGAEAQAGDTVETNYHLVTWSDGNVLDSSFERGQTFPLENLGQAPVIDGWNQGLIGIAEGSRRLLVVPPDLGYGQGGNGIKPNETLVFVVDAVSVS